MVSGDLWQSIHSQMGGTKKQTRSPMCVDHATHGQGLEPFSLGWSFRVSCRWAWWFGKGPGSRLHVSISFVPVFWLNLLLHLLWLTWAERDCTPGPQPGVSGEVPWGPAPGGLVPKRVSCPHRVNRWQLLVQAGLKVSLPESGRDSPCCQDCAVV